MAPTSRGCRATPLQLATEAGPAAPTALVTGATTSTNPLPRFSRPLIGWLCICFAATCLDTVTGQDEPVCSRNITSCCARMRREALEACLEYSRFGVTERSCLLWQQDAEFYCRLTCGNCTEVAKAIRGQCRFQLQVLVTGNNPAALVDRYCSETMESIAKYRCPNACDTTLNDCYSPEGVACQHDCGNYKDCWCRIQKGSLQPQRCIGTTVLTSPVRSRPDLRFSCDAVPESCFHNVPSSCGKYKYCPTDLCIIKDVQCPPRTQCENQGTCEASEGSCYYINRPDGAPCDDGIQYTSDDQCVAGACIGTADFCLRYNVSCAPMTPCLTNGVCQKSSGRCTYTAKPDGTVCDDRRAYTLEDRCQQGICIGQVVNLCTQSGVVCTAPSVCYSPGVCDPLTGLCSAPTPVTDARPCDDGDPTTANDTCLDGVCLGEVPGGAAAAQFQTLGLGVCTDRDGREMARYSGDVESESACEDVCRSDPQCAAYSYTYPLCSIYGTIRTGPPLGSRRWAFQVGSSPPAVVVEIASRTAVGQRVTVCRRKGTVGDSKAPPTTAVSVDDFFAPIRLGGFFLGAAACFFAWPVCRGIIECCSRRRRGSSHVVSAYTVRTSSPTVGNFEEEDEDDGEDRLRRAATSNSEGAPSEPGAQLGPVPALQLPASLSHADLPSAPTPRTPPGVADG